jgi:hypothetical protein
LGRRRVYIGFEGQACRQRERELIIEIEKTRCRYR